MSIKALSSEPYLPIKGRGAVRFRINTRSKSGRERVELIQKKLPKHVIFYANAYWMESPEVHAMTLAELREYDAALPIDRLETKQEVIDKCHACLDKVLKKELK